MADEAPESHVEATDPPTSVDTDPLNALLPEDLAWLKAQGWVPDVSAHSAARRAHLDRIRPLAAAWHSSPEGIKWHREHGRHDWGNREIATRNCNRCGKEYETPFPDRSRFCSPHCSRAVREAQGAYNVWVKCPACGIEFSQHKWKKTPTTCSRICGQRLRRQKQQEQ